MERELEKTLMEIEHLIKVHEQRGNTHTQSVLEQAREIIELCAQAARTPSDLKKILERDTAGACAAGNGRNGVPGMREKGSALG